MYWAENAFLSAAKRIYIVTYYDLGWHQQTLSQTLPALLILCLYGRQRERMTDTSCVSFLVSLFIVVGS